jgi:hypothetical protein
MYLTFQELIDIIGLTELSQFATSAEQKAINAHLLNLTILEGDRTGYSDEEIKTADATWRTIKIAVEDATRIINSYLKKAQLSQETIDANPIRRHCASIVRYYLAKDNPTEKIIADFTEAKSWLHDVYEDAELIKPSLFEDNFFPNIFTGSLESQIDWNSWPKL